MADLPDWKCQARNDSFRPLKGPDDADSIRLRKVRDDPDSVRLRKFRDEGPIRAPSKLRCIHYRLRKSDNNNLVRQVR